MGETGDDEAERERLTGENISSEKASKGKRGRKGRCILKCLGRLGN